VETVHYYTCTIFIVNKCWTQKMVKLKYLKLSSVLEANKAMFMKKTLFFTNDRR